MNRTKQVGFNLMEMLVVLAIISILASLLLDNNQGHQLKVEQAQAQQLLMAAMQQQQKYYSAHNRFTNDLNDLNMEPEQDSFLLESIQCDSQLGGFNRCIKITATHDVSAIEYSIDSSGNFSSH